MARRGTSSALASRRRSNDRRAFSLLELCVVVAILTLLAGLTLAGVARARTAGFRLQCGNNLRQMGLALQHYHDDHRVFPPGVSVAGAFAATPSLSWQARLLPYLELSALWAESVAAYRLRPQPSFTEPPHPGRRAVRVYHCPANPLDVAVIQPANRPTGLTSYLGVAGRNYRFHEGVLFPDSKVRLADIADGTSMTLLVGERPAMVQHRYGWWYAGAGQDGRGSLDLVLGAAELNVSVHTPDCPAGPYSFGRGELDDDCDVFHFWSRHPGGAHFLFCDGSVRFLPYAAASQLPALATRSRGEVIDSSLLP